MDHLPDTGKRLIIAAVIIYALVSMLLSVAVIFLQLDAKTGRKAASDERDGIKVQNDKIERQNKYKICLLEGIWDTIPEQRTLEQRQKCERENL